MEKTISKISQWLEGVFFFWFFQFPKDVLNNLFLSLSLPPHLLLSQTKDFSLSLSLSFSLLLSLNPNQARTGSNPTQTPHFFAVNQVQLLYCE